MAAMWRLPGKSLLLCKQVLPRVVGSIGTRVRSLSSHSAVVFMKETNSKGETNTNKRKEGSPKMSQGFPEEGTPLEGHPSPSGGGLDEEHGPIPSSDLRAEISELKVAMSQAFQNEDWKLVGDLAVQLGGKENRPAATMQGNGSLTLHLHSFSSAHTSTYYIPLLSSPLNHIAI
eukprot:m.306363 g.306363  ORF g.306363 m.306363 type:complete len:174 (+) comp16456_c0_seq2:119-640(+)